MLIFYNLVKSLWLVYIAKIIKLILVFFFLRVELSYAQAIHKDSQNLLHNAKVVVDASSQWSAKEALQRIRDGEYVLGDEAKAQHVGSRHNTIWVLISVSNPANFQRYRWIGMMRPELSRGDVYEVWGDTVTKLSYDDVRYKEEAHDRERHRLPMYRVGFEPYSTKILLLAIQSQLPINLSIESLSLTEYMQRLSHSQSTHFFYTGTIISLVVYSLFFYLSLKDKSFLLYAMFGFSMGVSNLLYSGFLHYWFDLYGTGLGQYELTQIFMLLSSVLSISYTMSMFNLKQSYRSLYLLGAGIIISATVCAVAVVFVDLFKVAVFVSTVQAVSVLFIILSSAMVYREQRTSAAALFLIGWGSLAISFVVWILGNNGYLEQTYWVSFAPLYGNIVEMMCTAIALSLHFYTITKENFDARITKKEKESLQTLVHVVCHDIASPLSVIMGSCELAFKEKATEKIRQQCWARVNRASKSIDLIIKKVKKLQAAKSGKTKISLEKVNLETVFEEVKFNLIDRANEKELNLEFSLEKEDSTDLVVIADETSLIYDVVINLVSNAIKFSPRNSTISISARRCNDRGRIEIEVTDRGVGIPEDILPVIFLESSRTSRRGTENEAGTGFGMPLTKFFIDQYGGDIQVKSQEQKKSSPSDEHGTTVTIVLDAA